jgi:transcriptional regulator with XRE-family HTH domain
MAILIGERIREVRLAQSRSLADVAGHANISVATLSRIENDKQSVELGLFVELAHILNVSANDLLDAAHAQANGNGSIDPLVRRISALGPRERLELWRDLATERRSQQKKKTKGSESRQMAQQVEELLAQLDFLREELEGVRKRIKRR